MPPVKREDLVRFARREWAAIEAAKTRHWFGTRLLVLGSSQA